MQTSKNISKYLLTSRRLAASRALPRNIEARECEEETRCRAKANRHQRGKFRTKSKERRGRGGEGAGDGMEIPRRNIQRKLN